MTVHRCSTGYTVQHITVLIIFPYIGLFCSQSFLFCPTVCCCKCYCFTL